MESGKPIPERLKNPGMNIPSQWAGISPKVLAIPRNYWMKSLQSPLLLSRGSLTWPFLPISLGVPPYWTSDAEPAWIPFLQQERPVKYGRVLGLDFSEAMLSRALQSVKDSSLDNVRFCRADAESIPAKDRSFDVAIVNGIFNLNPARDAIFRELARVVRREGLLFAAELVLKEGSAKEALSCDANWFA